MERNVSQRVAATVETTQPTYTEPRTVFATARLPQAALQERIWRVSRLGGGRQVNLSPVRSTRTCFRQNCEP